MSLGSNRQADHINRIVLSVLGALAVGAATAGLVVSYLESTRDQPVLDPSQRSWLLDYGTLLGIVALVVTLGATAGVVVWLRHQFRPIAETGDLTLDRTDAGTTVLRTHALTAIIETELVDLRGVAAATARIRESDPNTIDVILDIDDTARVRRLAHEASTQTLARARRATARPELALMLECRPVAATPSPRVA